MASGGELGDEVLRGGRRPAESMASGGELGDEVLRGGRRPAESMASGGKLGDEELLGGWASWPNRARQSSDRARRRLRGEQGEVRAALAVAELEQGEAELPGGFRGTSTATSGGSVRAGGILGRLERGAWIGFCSVLKCEQYICRTRHRNLAHALNFFPALYFTASVGALFFLLSAR
jgi:hypothetical protein